MKWLQRSPGLIPGGRFDFLLHIGHGTDSELVRVRLLRNIGQWFGVQCPGSEVYWLLCSFPLVLRHGPVDELVVIGTFVNHEVSETRESRVAIGRAFGPCVMEGCVDCFGRGASTHAGMDRALGALMTDRENDVAHDKEQSYMFEGMNADKTSFTESCDRCD